MNYQPTTWQWQSLAGAGGRRNSQGVFVEEDVYLPIKIRPFYCSSIVWSGDIPSSVEEQYGKCNFFQLCLIINIALLRCKAPVLLRSCQEGLADTSVHLSDIRGQYSNDAVMGGGRQGVVVVV